MAVVVVPATTTTTTAATTTVAAAPVATTTTTAAAPVATTTAAPAVVATPAPAGAPVNLSTPAPDGHAGEETHTPARLPAEAIGSIEYQAGNQPGVDDNTFGATVEGGMPRNNSDILASGMMTPEQVEASKIENIQKLYDCSNCTQAQYEELGLYLQRYVMDGYIRGVDVTGMILGGQDEKIMFHMGGANENLSGVADTGGGGNVTLRGFDSASDGWKFSLFYHEVSHNILERGHNLNSQSMMYGPNNIGNLRSPDQISSNYDYMLGELFNPDNWGKTAPGGNAPVNTIPEGFTDAGTPAPNRPTTPVTPTATQPIYSEPYSQPYTYSPTSTTTTSPYGGPTSEPRRQPLRFDPIPTLSLDDNGEIQVPQQLSGAATQPTTGYPTPGYSGTSGSNFRSPYGAPPEYAPSGAAPPGPSNEFEAELDQVIQQASPLLSQLGGALAGMKSS